ncbi:hypothetical protein VT06_01260 [Arsukibacterium sp. MJ3]|nr:hypothetical protein VT06_01260 [Arsukibacterium sp. MJ3]
MLEKHRVQTVVSGVYLKAWRALSKHLAAINKVSWLEHRLVTFTDQEEEFVIFIKQPRASMIRGGGDPECRVRKSDYPVVKCVFER